MKTTYNNNKNIDYVYGNVVEKRHYDSLGYPYIEKDNDKVYRVKRESYIGKGQFVALCLSLIIFVAASYTLILENAKFSDSIQLKGEKTRDLDILVRDNEQMLLSLEYSVDIEDVKKVAIEELGMVYPSENQVIKYDKSESEYIRQYDDIPKN